MSPDLENTPEGKYTLDEWAECLEGFLAHIPVARWMNHPSRNACASHKLEQISRARAFGLRVPKTLLTQDEGELRRFFEACDGQVIVKPLAGGYVERPDKEDDTLIYTNSLGVEELSDLDDLVGCPTLFQQRIDKSTDVRITIIDNDVHAVSLTALDPDGLQRCDIRRNNMEDVQYQVIQVPKLIHGILMRFMEHYELRFAAIDMVIDTDGNWYFLEINPNG